MKINEIHQGDALMLLKQMENDSVDLIVTDPPYGIEFMGKEWDKAVPSVDVWKECIRVLKPGAFAFIMTSPRLDVQSQMTIRLQESGFRVDFTPIYWAYAQGFPKAINIGKAIDKKMGREREVIGQKKLNPRDKKPYMPNSFNGMLGTATFQTNPNMCFESIPSSDEAKLLEGSFGGYQPKPAVEVIIVAMKPLSKKTFVNQSLDNGKGVTWLDNCRVPFTNVGEFENRKRGVVVDGEDLPETEWNRKSGFKTYNSDEYLSEKGRFPANLLVSDDVLNDGHITKSEGGQSVRGKENKVGEWGFVEFKMQGYGDSGSFSRYFSLDTWWEKRVEKLPNEAKQTFPFLLVPKATTSEKNEGCENFENIRNCRWNNNGEWKNLETKQYGNIHPTCKPIKLMGYLVTLGSREGDLVLDPFIGSGTTGIACRLLSRDFIGFELNEEYIKIADARLRPYLDQKKLFEFSDTPLQQSLNSSSVSKF